MTELRDVGEKGVKPTFTLKDIFASSVNVDIKDYIALLQDIEPGEELNAGLSAKTLERSKVGLVKLLEILKIWTENPHSFKIARVQSGRASDKHAWTVKFRLPSSPDRLPFEDEEPEVQLGIQVDLRRVIGETRDQAIRQESLKGQAPEDVLRMINRYKGYDFKIIFNTLDVWVNSRKEKVLIDPNAGLELAYEAGLKGNVRSRGVTYVGQSMHFSETLSPNAMGPTHFLFIAATTIDIIEKYSNSHK